MSSEPIVFWGPGSEWFWAMAQFVVVAVTLVGIYYQFRLQRAANVFDQLNRIAADMESEPMLRARLDVARAIAAGEVPPEGAMTLVANYWENVASLVRGGHVDRTGLYESSGASAPVWWAALGEPAQEVRRRRRDPTVWRQFEWLAETFAVQAAEKDEGFSLDRDTLVRVFESGIPGIEERIRLAEDSRLPPHRPAARSRRSAGSKQVA